MANKIFRDLKPQTHLNRNGFDLSNLFNFTAKIGELLPVDCIETVPGGHYEIKVADLLRTIPMQKAAYIRATQHFEFYFVPYKQLWRYWDDFYTTRSVPTSAQHPSLTPPAAAPNFSLLTALTAINSGIADSTINPTGDIGENIAYGASKVMNFLGYRGLDNYGIITQAEDVHPNLFRAAAYQKICFDYYRQPYFDTPREYSAMSYNLDDADFETGLVPSSISLSSGETFSRYLQCFQLHYRQWKKDIYTGIMPSTQFGAVSVVNTGGNTPESLIPLHLPVRGASALGSNIVGVTLQNGSIKFNSADPDDYQNQPVTATQVNGSTFLGQGSSHSEITAELNNRAGYMSYTYFNNALNTALLGYYADGNLELPASYGGSFDVLSLVRAQAVQKWREITMRSGFRNQSQYEGHFGVKPIYTEKDRCVFIDSVSSPLQINAVVNQTAYANANQPALGDLAANGTSRIDPSKTIKFDAKDFGIIMCIYSMLPEATYGSAGVALMNQKILRDDFFTPEFENIGLQPLFVTSDYIKNSQDGSGFLGYVPRYSEYKIGRDTNTAQFNDLDYSLIQDDMSGMFAGWSPQRRVNLTVGNFYVSPEYYAMIFVKLPYSHEGADDIGNSEFDTFVHQCYFDKKAVLPMSVLGLPQY